MSNPEPEWVSLLEINDRIQAEIFVEALEAQGIKAVIFQEGVAHYLYPGISGVNICVPSDQLELAQQWLEKYDAKSLTKEENTEMSPVENGTILMITNNGMGRADLPLQHKLMGKYLDLLLENGELPNAICFYTEGVRLVVEESPVLAQLHALEDAGVRLIVCTTCLDYFGLKDKVKVGIPGGMGDILEAQLKAAKVITL